MAFSLPGDRIDKRGPGGFVSRLAATLSVASVLALAPTPVVRAQEVDRRTPGVQRVPPAEIADYWFPRELAQHALSHRSEGWLPVYLELRTARASTQYVEVTLEVGRTSRQGKDAPSFELRRRVEVSPGASRRLWLYLRYEHAAEGPGTVPVRLELLSGQQVLATHAEAINIFGGTRQRAGLLMVVSGEGVSDGDPASPWTRNYGYTTSTSGVSPRALARGDVVLLPGGSELGVDARRLPDDPLGYQSVDLVVLRNVPEDDLERRQVEALRRWVFLGGRVVFVPSESGEMFKSAAVRAFLPPEAFTEVRLEPGFRPEYLVQVRDEQVTLAHSGPPPAEDAWRGAFVRCDPIVAPPLREIVSVAHDEVAQWRRTDAIPVARLAATRLYHEHRFGDGVVGFLTIDDQAHAGRVGDPSRDFRQDLWHHILEQRQRDTSWSRRVASLQNGDVSLLLKEGLSSDLGVWFIGGLALFYVALVGPGLYFGLKRMRRLPAFVWIEPLIVLVYVGAIFLTGYLSRGMLTQSRAVTVFSWQQGQPYLFKDSYLGILSNQDMRYSVSSEGETWLRPAFGSREDSQPIRLSTPSAGAQPRIDGFRLDIWQLGCFSASTLLPSRGTIEVETVYGEAGPGGVRQPQSVRLENDSPFRIARAFVVDGQRNSRLYRLDSPIAPGSGGEVALAEAHAFTLADFAGESDDDSREEEGEIERPLPDAPLDRDVVHKLLTKSSLKRFGGMPRVIAFLERDGGDFDVDPGNNLLHRADLLLVYE